MSRGDFDRLVQAAQAGPLAQARLDLARRAETAEGWADRGVLRPLAAVADMVCRIGDGVGGGHYRVEKAGELVDDALELYAGCLRAMVDSESIDDDLCDASRLVRGLAVRAGRVMRGVAVGGGVTASEARDLRTAVDLLARLAESVSATAVPDSVDW